MEKTNNITGDEDYKLWKFFKDEHDLILTDGQITDIVIEVEKYHQTKGFTVCDKCGEKATYHYIFKELNKTISRCDKHKSVNSKQIK